MLSIANRVTVSAFNIARMRCRAFSNFFFRDMNRLLRQIENESQGFVHGRGAPELFVGELSPKNIGGTEKPLEEDPGACFGIGETDKIINICLHHAPHVGVLLQSPPFQNLDDTFGTSLYEKARCLETISKWKPKNSALGAKQKTSHSNAENKCCTRCGKTNVALGAEPNIALGAEQIIALGAEQIIALGAE